MDEMSKNMSFEYGDEPKFREQETGHVYFKEAADESTEPFAKNVKLEAHTEYTSHVNGKIGGGSGGTSAILDDLIEGKSGIHLVSNAESVVDGAFTCYKTHGHNAVNIGFGWYLESVSLPNATSIGWGAFGGCSTLTSVYLPNATSIGGGAFEGCSALTSVDLPNATSIGGGAFGACSALTSVDLPNATSIGESAFGGCSALTSVYLPNATSIGEDSFVGISTNAVINLGAAEGEISGAPWGAPNGVTINYNVRPTQEG